MVLWAWLTSVAAAQTLPGISSLPSSPPGVLQEGPYLTAPVVFNGSVLFRLAATVAPGGEQVPVNVRASYVESVLAEIVAVTGTGREAKTAYDPKTLRIKTASQNGLTYLAAVDATHPDPLPVVTVTSTDAAFYGQTVASLAAQWQDILHKTLAQTLLELQPASQRRSFEAILRVAAGLSVFTLIVALFFIVPLRKRMTRLSDEVSAKQTEAAAAAQEVVESDSDLPRKRSRFMSAARDRADPASRLLIVRGSVAALQTLVSLTWFGAIVWALSLFPETTPLGHNIFTAVCEIVGTWILALLVILLLELLTARLIAAWGTRIFGSADERARQALRVPTVTQALNGFSRFVVIFVALLTSFGWAGIPVASVLTIGGVAAIGITLAAQNLVRDFLNGFLVLLEDQYVVGDYVTINAQSGLVERLTLRIVQIRDAGGDLITIPHSAVTTVTNQSRNWSRVDFRVSIDPAADITKALEIVRDAMKSLGSTDGALRGAVLEPVEWIGVSGLSRDGVIIEASMKTAPLRQFELRRRLYERVRNELARSGIALGAPQAP